MIVYYMSHLPDACQISTEKIKKTQTLRKKVREFTKLESLFEPHCKVIASYTQLLHFFRYAWGLVFVQFNYWQFDPIYFLIHWIDTCLQALLPASLKGAIVTYEVHNLPCQVKMRDTF